jgi:hypothetical protein
MGIGVFAIIIFVALYLYQQFELINAPAYVSVNALRFNSALAMTLIILLVVLIISFRRGIIAFIRNLYGSEEESDNAEIR